MTDPRDKIIGGLNDAIRYAKGEDVGARAAIYSQGWAVKDPKGINVKTVSDTRRAAVVNWLVVEKGVMVLNAATDREIEDLWRRLCGPSEVTKVTIHQQL